MPNLRELAESDLGVTLESDFGLPIELTAPDGSQQTLGGQILYDTVELNPETGEPTVSDTPVVVLRVSSLTMVPQDGETWHVRIPVTPNRTATKEDFVFTPSRPGGGGASIGYLKLYLQRIAST